MSEILHQKEYAYQAKEGTLVGVKIEAKIEENHKDDLNEILREFADCTHDFYLSLGREITGST